MSDTGSLFLRAGRLGAELRNVETRETDGGGQKILLREGTVE